MVCKTTKQASLHPLAETPYVKIPRALALFSYDRFLVPVDQGLNDLQRPFRINNYSETDVVISDFESDVLKNLNVIDVWHENADCSPIILAVREG